MDSTRTTPTVCDSPAESKRLGLYRYLATSDRALPTLVRRVKKSLRSLAMPAPRIVVRPILLAYVALRTCYHWAWRVFICEPLFKVYCKQYGRGLHTGEFLHWVQGKGDIILGDHVWIDGRCTINFAARFSDRPTLKVGNNTGIGHDCRFTIGKRITIGNNCSFSSGTVIMDSNGHPSEPEARIARKPPKADEVRPVVIGDGVWIGMRCMIFPGVRVGDGAVISAGSVVRSHVPPYAVVAGNPAKVIFRLKPRSTQLSSASDPNANGASTLTANGAATSTEPERDAARRSGGEVGDGK